MKDGMDGCAEVQDHVLRHELNNELHMRRFPMVQPPFRSLQIMLVRETAPLNTIAGIERQRVLDIAKGPDIVTIETGPSFILCLDGDTTVRWEQHTEFSTVTFLRTDGDTRVFDAAEWEPLRKRWVQPDFGKILRGVQVCCLDRSTTVPDAIVAEFDNQSLVSSSPFAGAARIWSDFQRHNDGYGRLLIKDQGLAGHQCRRLVQTLLEIGNYRKACLMGLPEVHGVMKGLHTTEVELAQMVRQLSSNAIDNGTAFNQLARFSDRVETQISELTYRFEASRAYYRLAMERISALDEHPVGGFETLQQFTERRLTPGFRTIDSTGARLHQVSDRIARISGIIRTRISAGLEDQHVTLLRALNRRIRVNTRLQAALERFSFIAISYYLIGILSDIVDALEFHTPSLSASSLKLVIVPVAIISVWFSMARTKKSLFTGDW